MRMLLVLVLVCPAAGCDKFKPAPPVVILPAPTPSVLVRPRYSESRKHPVFPAMQHIGSTGLSQDNPSLTYRWWEEVTLARRDNSEVDPRDIADIVCRWMQSASGVRVKAIHDDPSDPRKVQRTVDYETASMVGYAVFSVEQALSSRSVRYKINIRERVR